MAKEFNTDLDIDGDITLTGTVDGRDVATDGAKLDGIASGAEVNVQSDWNAGSGDAFISNKPTISGTNTGDEPDATTSVKGIVELATETEVNTGTDTTRAVTPASLATIQSDVDANTSKTGNATHTGEVTGSTALVVADNIIDEANLKLDEAPTNDYVLTADSTKTGGMKWAAAAGGGSSPILSAYKTADETKTSDTTLANDTDLVVTLEANSLYAYELAVYHDATGTPDMKVTLYAPSGSTGGWTLDHDNGAGYIGAFGATQLLQGFGSKRRAMLKGVVETTTAGDLGLQWAQNVSDASGSTLKKNSYLIVTKIN